METPPAKNKGGRPQGSMNKLAAEAVERARSTGELPHEFLLRMSRGQIIYREELDPLTGAVKQVEEKYDFEARKDAAKAAAPYFAPKISTVEVIKGVPDDELDSIIARLAAEAGVGIGAGGESTEDEGEASPTPRRRVTLRE